MPPMSIHHNLIISMGFFLLMPFLYHRHVQNRSQIKTQKYECTIRRLFARALMFLLFLFLSSTCFFIIYSFVFPSNELTDNYSDCESWLDRRQNRQT